MSHTTRRRLRASSTASGESGPGSARSPADSGCGACVSIGLSLSEGGVVDVGKVEVGLVGVVGEVNLLVDVDVEVVEVYVVRLA